MGDEFKRPADGFRFQFGGLKTNTTPDNIPVGKYAMAVNVRGVDEGSVQTRPGVVALFNGGSWNHVTAPGLAFTAMRAYTALGTDNLPRILAYDREGEVWLDTGTLAGTLSTPIAGSLGASMIPFRPNASPSPWMYVASASDYQKFSAPSATNVVTQQKVGIAEPQKAPDAVPLRPAQRIIATANPTWSHAGTAGAATGGTRISDTAGVVFIDPNPVAGACAYVQVTSGVAYQRGMTLYINSVNMIVGDVFPALASTLAIAGIYYFTGTTGHCIVVPLNVAAGAGNDDTSIYGTDSLSTLRRGSIIKIASEYCLVLSVTPGPDGTIAIETSTTGTHTTADTMTSVPSIQVLNATPVASNGISALDVTYQVTMGVGTQSATVGNPFALASGFSFQPDDYITIGILVDNLSNLTEMKILFDVGDGSFTENFYYYTVRPSDIIAGIANTLTQLAAAQVVSQRAVIDEEDAAAANNQLQTASSEQTSPGSSQWSQITFPISALTRVGSDDTLSLQTLNAVQVLWNASGTINVATSEMDVYGGGQLDVGDVGAPYLYRVRPRSSLTGVVGNPSPATRYGISPRRGQVELALYSSGYDLQIDTWDVFRYGGSVTEWRFIGSVASSAGGTTAFIDNFSDSAAQAGDALDFDNFEPWPSVDIPNNGTASIVNGTIAVVSSTDPDITSYLPGTLVLLGGQNAYTLQVRPTLISGTNYLLQFIENAGAATNVPYQIQEPFLANQHLPYVWGPDANGTVFACGDQFRPGSLYFSKNYAPDSAPDSYNQEISQPSEPLLGGETLDGLAFVASSERWWALYPQPDNPSQRYNVVQQPFTRGLGAPFGHCNDGQSIYWWAKDGIWSSSKGSLTDADLYNLFPHEGVLGNNVTYNNVTVFAPDYSRAALFRLAYSNGYLYAVYLDTSGLYRTLTLDVKRMAWSVDQVGGSGVTAVYHVEQPEGTLQSTSALYAKTLFASFTGSITFTAVVGVQTVNANDFAGPIACTLATAEYDGGDVRAPKQWGDLFLDCAPQAGGGIVATPMSLGSGAAAPTTIPTSASRQRVPVSVGGVVVSDFLGVQTTWTDDFSSQTLPTKVRIWQPSFAVQPARSIAWYTFGSSFGAKGYLHVKEVAIAYVSTAPVTLTITSYDGQSPAAVTLPSTGGVYQKTLFVLTPNKGQLYKFQATSAAQFQIFLDDCEVRVGEWGRPGPYATSRNFGGTSGREAVV